MGKDFIPLKENGFNLEGVYNIIYTFKTISASKENYFYVKPDLEEIENIEIGTDGTEEIILRLKNNDFIVLEGTIDISSLS